MTSLMFGLFFFLILFFVMWVFVNSFFKKNDVENFSWVSPYECGFISNFFSVKYFSFTYFSLMIFFVIFDLEISLLLNMFVNGMLFVKFYYYYFFLFVLLVSFLLEIMLGYVRWSY